MIHFAIGTKAQFIKMAPIMYLLQQQGEEFHLLDLSQHGSLTGKILNDFDLKPRITRLGKSNESVVSYAQAIKWLALGVKQIIWHRRKICQRLFLGQDGIVLLHGDTLSTLLGFHLAKSARLKTALVEAGLTSGSLLNPFPEEWIRRYTGKKVDVLFPPDAVAEAWLRARRLPGQIICTGYNTGRDSLSLILQRHQPNGRKTAVAGSYGIATLHRLETISSKARLRRTIRHILNLTEELGPVKFYMHPPTERALNNYGLMSEIASHRSIEIHGLEPYPSFVASMTGARFILTDGGSIQEESAYLGKPCLILRERTERREGIGHNALLSTWSIARDVDHLMSKIRGANGPHPGESGMHASNVILKTVRSFR